MKLLQIRMSRNRILILFTAAGLILAAVIGVFVYQTFRAPSEAEIRAVISDFIADITAGDLESARELMTMDTRSMLYDPITLLGETIYRNLKLKTIDEIRRIDEKTYTADVILNAPDSLTITSKALEILFSRFDGPSSISETDRKLAGIYEELLSREDLPMMDYYCVFTLKVENGKLLIRADNNLVNTLEGNIGQILPPSEFNIDSE